jgi:hypothetical protein
MDWRATVRYNIHMLVDEEDVPLPQDQAPGEQWAEDQFDDELMRALAERPLQEPHRQPAGPQ